MPYSEEWNDIYARGEQMARWPWSDLVALVKRYCGDMLDMRVLELGCGVSGPNEDFFKQGGALYTGIDGALDGAFGMDFTKELPSGLFDLICDRAAVTHNDTKSIQRCLSMVYDALKPGGFYVGVDYFSFMHCDACKGEFVDSHTFRDIPDGQFQGCGEVHFSSAEHLTELFSAFEIEDISHKVVSSMKPGEAVYNGIFASYNIVARKL